MVDPALPLDGFRVVAFEVAAAGPFCTQLLADMGADVVKIERPGTGDTIRGWDNAVHGLSSGYVWVNRNKRSIALDVKSDNGKAVMRRLAERADVFLENFAPGVVDGLSLGYGDLSALNPRLVYCSISGYGQDGPYRDRKAFDLLIQGEAGIISTTGSPDAPAKASVPVADIAAGMYASNAILMALLQRERTGAGQYIDIAMFDAMLSWLAYFPHHYWHQGELPERVGMRHHYVTPYGPFKAKDGRYVNFAVASPRDWDLFCKRVLRREDIFADELYATVEGRRRHRVELEAVIDEAFASADSKVWLERLAEAELPYGSVRDIAEVLDHPQVLARGMVREVDSPVGPVPVIANPIKMSGAEPRHGPIPSLGGDTDDVLRDAGFADDEIASMRADGAVA
jgi:itaconate CoA-transferase